MSDVTMPRLWPGETVVCIASGPSLTQADCDYVRGKARVIVINRSVERAPWADLLYCADARMWQWLHGAPEFAGLKYGLQARIGGFKVEDHGVRVLKTSGSDGFDVRPWCLRTGGHSGYQAICLAVLAGAKRILLLGYDAQASGKRQRWHEPHPSMGQAPYNRWVAVYKTLVAPLRELGVAVINCSRETAITAFPRMSLAEALP